MGCSSSLGQGAPHPAPPRKGTETKTLCSVRTADGEEEMPEQLRQLSCSGKTAGACKTRPRRASAGGRASCLWGRASPWGAPGLEGGLGIFLLRESQAPLLLHKAKSGLDRGPSFLPSAGIKGVEEQLPGLGGGGPKSGASSPPRPRDRSPEGASGGPQEPRSQKNEFSSHYCFTPEAKVFQEVLG